jgi:hypothetical protein
MNADRRGWGVMRREKTTTATKSMELAVREKLLRLESVNTDEEKCCEGMMSFL